MKLPLFFAALLAAAVCAFPATAGAYTTCKPGKYPGSGYFTSLKVTKTTCATGRKLELAFYHCRVRHGLRGHCAGVMGYKCTEKRVSIPTELDARVTCTRGARKILHTYQQNT